MTSNNNFHIFSASISSDYSQWWRYNLFITIVGYDQNGDIICHKSGSDRVMEIDRGANAAPASGQERNLLVVESDMCAYVDVYVYVITNTFPESTAIRESPPFAAQLHIKRDGEPFETTTHEVNQWGGLTIVAHRAG